MERCVPVALEFKIVPPGRARHPSAQVTHDGAVRYIFRNPVRETFQLRPVRRPCYPGRIRTRHILTLCIRKFNADRRPVSDPSTPSVFIHTLNSYFAPVSTGMDWAHTRYCSGSLITHLSDASPDRLIAASRL